jgi:hypothetical protein
MAHRGVSVKTLKRMLKKKGLKTTGRKAALTRRAKKAHMKVGGFTSAVGSNPGDVPGLDALLPRPGDRVPDCPPCTCNGPSKMKKDGGRSRRR